MKMILDHIQTFKSKDLEVDMDKFNTLCNIVKLSEKICSDYDEIKIDFNEESIACVVTSYVLSRLKAKKKKLYAKYYHCATIFNLDLTDLTIELS